MTPQELEKLLLLEQTRELNPAQAAALATEIDAEALRRDLVRLMAAETEIPSTPETVREQIRQAAEAAIAWQTASGNRPSSGKHSENPAARLARSESASDEPRPASRTRWLPALALAAGLVLLASFFVMLQMSPPDLPSDSVGPGIVALVPEPLQDIDDQLNTLDTMLASVSLDVQTANEWIDPFEDPYLNEIAKQLLEE